jgi:hypothetical protein
MSCMYFGILVEVLLTMPILGSKEHLSLGPWAMARLQDQVIKIRPLLVIVTGYCFLGKSLSIMEVISWRKRSVYLNPNHVVGREMEVSNHIVLARLHQGICWRIPGKEVPNCNLLVGKAVLQARNVVGL